jgi:hypothetical protein
VTLFPGDEIVVALNEGVKVTGNVLLTSEIPYDKRKRFGITNAVGVDSKAGRKSLYYLSNGKAAVAHSFFLFARIPKQHLVLKCVPEKPEVKKMSTAEL